MDPRLLPDIQRDIVRYLTREELWMLAEVEQARPTVEIGLAARGELQRLRAYKRVYHPGVWTLRLSRATFEAAGAPSPCFHPFVRSSRVPRPDTVEVPLRGLKVRSLVLSDVPVVEIKGLTGLGPSLEELEGGSDVTFDLDSIDLSDSTCSLKAVRMAFAATTPIQLLKEHLDSMVADPLQIMPVASYCFAPDAWERIERLPNLEALFCDAWRLAGLSQLTNLRFLSIRGEAENVVDLRPLTKLEHFAFGGYYTPTVLLAPCVTLRGLTVLSPHLPPALLPSLQTVDRLTTDLAILPGMLATMTQLRGLTVLGGSDYIYDISGLTLLKRLRLKHPITDPDLSRHTRLTHVVLEIHDQHNIVLPTTVEVASVDTCCNVQHLTRLRKLRIEACARHSVTSIPSFTHLASLRSIRADFSLVIPLPTGIRKLITDGDIPSLQGFTNLVHLVVNYQPPEKLEQLVQQLPKLRALVVRTHGDLGKPFAAALLDLARRYRLEIFHLTRGLPPPSD